MPPAIGRARRLGAGCAALLILGSPVRAQGTTPRPAPSEYPVHTALGRASLGAEYLVRSLPGQGQTFDVRDYLVLEVAVYPAQGESFMVSSGHFTLRVNGRKQTLYPQTPGMVAASLKYADWERRPTLQAGAGVGDTGVILGAPPPVERFPGDRRPTQNRLPKPPRAPDTPGNVERREPASAEEVAVQTTLPEGETRGPVSGHLYYAFKGKTKSIKSLELLYRGPAGEAALKLF